MSTDTFDRKRQIQIKYERLKTEISMWKRNIESTERKFTVTIDHLEHDVLDKVRKTADETRRKAKHVLKETSERTNKLKERVQESSEWFSSQEKSKQKLMDYERKIEELRDELNLLKKTEFRMVTCSHVVNFIDNCEQLIKVDPEDNENAANKQQWTCTDFISHEQSRRQSVASSSFCNVSGKPPSCDREVSMLTHVSDADENDGDGSQTTNVINPLEEITLVTDSDYNLCSKSLVCDIKAGDSEACFPGKEHGAIKAISVSNEENIVALGSEQKSYFFFDKSYKFIIKSNFQVKDYPNDVEFLESEEIIISPVMNGSVNNMLRMLSCGSNKTMKKIESTKLNCPMGQHCVSVRKQQNGCFLACIVCPKELLLISYNKNGRVSNSEEPAVLINDRVVVDSLKQERYAVKLNEDATEAYVIKSDTQSLNCFKLEGESLGKTKWRYESKNMNLKDLCVYGKHVFVTENAYGKIIEFETDFGKIVHTIDLHPFSILNPFAITMKQNKLYLSEYSDGWGRGKHIRRRKTITVLSFKDTKTP